MIGKYVPRSTSSAALLRHGAISLSRDDAKDPRKRKRSAAKVSFGVSLVVSDLFVSRVSKSLASTASSSPCDSSHTAAPFDGDVIQEKKLDELDPENSPGVFRGTSVFVVAPVASVALLSFVFPSPRLARANFKNAPAHFIADLPSAIFSKDSSTEYHSLLFARKILDGDMEPPRLELAPGGPAVENTLDTNAVTRFLLIDSTPVRFRENARNTFWSSGATSAEARASKANRVETCAVKVSDVDASCGVLF